MEREAELYYAKTALRDHDERAEAIRKRIKELQGHLWAMDLDRPTLLRRVQAAITTPRTEG